jgi:hypothetical protein
VPVEEWAIGWRWENHDVNSGLELPDLRQHLVDLETQFDPTVSRDYDSLALVRFALSASDYWAGLALKWPAAGVPAGTLTESSQLSKVSATVRKLSATQPDDYARQSEDERALTGRRRRGSVVR